jgi:hypothetical protein
MHRCLQIPELLERVLRLASAADTLYNCAVTCHHFSGLALDILWGAHRDLMHALAVMPPDLWDPEGIEIEDFNYLVSLYSVSDACRYLL